jgi:hypothetical protein
MVVKPAPPGKSAAFGFRKAPLLVLDRPAGVPLSAEGGRAHVVGGDHAAAEQRHDARDAQQLAAQVAQVRQHADQRHLLRSKCNALCQHSRQVTSQVQETCRSALPPVETGDV